MKYFVEVYGCTANKSDATLIKGLIRDHPHHQLVSTIADADTVIILTCTVISTTEQRMLHRIRKLDHTKKNLVIAGCMASVQQEYLKKQFPNATLLPPRKIHLLFNNQKQKSKTETLEQKALASKQCIGLIAPVAIAEGCLFSCSYCITHLARGTLFSYSENSVINTVKDVVSQGCKEIQLTAQDTASYGRDHGSSLPTLLKYIIKIKGDFMIRVGMMNPRTATTIYSELIDLYHDKHLFTFMHLPIQSGDNTILSKMNRGYTVEEAEQIVTTCRTKIPDLTIATDAIVGFPTETKVQFQKTEQLLQRIQPDIVNITRFSARPFTKAKSIPGRIPTEIAKDRSRRLTKFCKELTLKRNEQYLGKTMQVLTLKKGKDHSIISRSTNYKPVIIKKRVALGKRRAVEIIDATDTFLVGMLK